MFERLTKQSEKSDSHRSSGNTNHDFDEQKKKMSKIELSPGSYWLTRVLFLRYLAFIYMVAFTVALHQNKELIGERGLTPVSHYLERMGSQFGPDPVSRVVGMPTLFWFVDAAATDWWLDTLALLGIIISLVILVTGTANMLLLLSLWVLYQSLVNVGQVWYAFGWESQLLETGFLAIWAVPFLYLAQFPAFLPSPWVVRWGNRWLIFRIMLGAGLIKVRGDSCWLNLTCMNYFYETQPNPNPVAYYAHQAPQAWHSFETLGNHVIELLLPWLTFFPWRWAWITNGCFQIFFQAVLISTGNLSFLNWLTVAPSIWYLDDRLLSPLFSRAAVARVQVLQVEDRVAFSSSSPAAAATSKGRGLRPSSTAAGRTSWLRRGLSLLVAGLIGYLSLPIVANLLSSNQVMNTSFDPFRLVNTYGAFGHVTKERTEVVVEGTVSEDPLLPEAVWEEFEFKCKPGNVTRAPCLISPYHYRLDWLMWFAAFQRYQQNPWLLHLLGKMLENDPLVDSLLAHNPFRERGRPPRYVRAQHYKYVFTRAGGRTAVQDGQWWKRRLLGEYVPPVRIEDLDHVYKQFGWSRTTV